MPDIMLDHSILDKLASVDSPTIANIIELFGVRSEVAGYTNAAIRALYPDLPPVVGYAVTATFRGAYPTPQSSDLYGNLGRILKAGESLPAPRIAVIQDLDDPIKAAVYGEVMVTGLRAFGFDALITNGAGRDYQQVKALEFPCYVSSLIVAHGYCNILDVAVPVTIGGLAVEPGDLLHGDANGIVQIPADLALPVSELIDDFVASEQTAMDAANEADVTVDKLQEAIRRHKARLGEMTERARKRIAE